MNTLRPNNVQFRSTESEITLTFSAETGESLEVILSQKAALSVAARLNSELRSNVVVAIRPDHLATAQEIHPIAFYIQIPNLGNGRRLVVIAELPETGQNVMIPLELAPSEIEKLIEELGGKY